jgi:hypothetical protein
MVQSDRRDREGTSFLEKPVKEHLLCIRAHHQDHANETVDTVI